MNLHTHYDPELYDPFSERDLSDYVPLRTAEYTCPICNEKIRHPVMPDNHNWEEDAVYWQRAFKKEREKIEGILKYLQEEYGEHSTLYVDVSNYINDLDWGDRDGEEWKDPD